MVLASGYYAELGAIIKEFDFQVIRSYGNYEKIRIRKMNINRPGLQLVGFYDYFDNERIQLLGKVCFALLPDVSCPFVLLVFSHLIPEKVFYR